MTDNFFSTKICFSQIIKKIVGDMTFQVPEELFCEILHNLPGGNLKIYLSGASFLYHFLESCFCTECS